VDTPTEATAGELMPSSLPIVSRQVVFRGAIPHVQVFCASCACGGPFIPEVMREQKVFVCYLCEPCAEKWSPMLDTLLVPDEVFWARVKAEQLEREGRELTPLEIYEALKNSDHYLSKLARSRYA
jgi:hypothetical protein